MTTEYFNDLLETTKKLEELEFSVNERKKSTPSDTETKDDPEIYERKKSSPKIKTESVDRHKVDIGEPIVTVNSYKLGKPVLYSIKVENGEEGTYEIWRRYNEFLKLHIALKKVTQRYTFPQFPEKLLFGNKSEENLKNRLFMLDTYMQRVSGELEFTKQDAYKKFIAK